MLTFCYVNMKSTFLIFTLQSSHAFLASCENMSIYKYCNKYLHHLRLFSHYFLQHSLLRGTYYFKSGCWCIRFSIVHTGRQQLCRSELEVFLQLHWNGMGQLAVAHCHGQLTAANSLWPTHTGQFAMANSLQSTHHDQLTQANMPWPICRRTTCSGTIQQFNLVI